MSMTVDLVGRDRNVLRYLVRYLPDGGARDSMLPLARMRQDLGFLGSALDQVLEAAEKEGGLGQMNRRLLGVGFDPNSAVCSIVEPGFRHAACSVLPYHVESCILSVFPAPGPSGPVFFFGVKSPNQEDGTWVFEVRAEHSMTA